MDNRRIRQTEEEKDLGVVIHDSAKPSRQCTEAAAKIRFWAWSEERWLAETKTSS